MSKRLHGKFLGNVDENVRVAVQVRLREILRVTVGVLESLSTLVGCSGIENLIIDSLVPASGSQPRAGLRFADQMVDTSC